LLQHPGKNEAQLLGAISTYLAPSSSSDCSVLTPCEAIMSMCQGFVLSDAAPPHARDHACRICIAARSHDRFSAEVCLHLMLTTHTSQQSGTEKRFRHAQEGTHSFLQSWRRLVRDEHLQPCSTATALAFNCKLAEQRIAN
jgi:hypothetical protein